MEPPHPRHLATWLPNRITAKEIRCLEILPSDLDNWRLITSVKMCFSCKNFRHSSYKLILIISTLCNNTSTFPHIQTNKRESSWKIYVSNRKTIYLYLLFTAQRNFVHCDSCLKYILCFFKLMCKDEQRVLPHGRIIKLWKRRRILYLIKYHVMKA
jgi:hypothetical protein